MEPIKARLCPFASLAAPPVLVYENLREATRVVGAGVGWGGGEPTIQIPNPEQSREGRGEAQPLKRAAVGGCVPSLIAPNVHVLHPMTRRAVCVGRVQNLGHSSCPPPQCLVSMTLQAPETLLLPRLQHKRAAQDAPRAAKHRGKFSDAG